MTAATDRPTVTIHTDGGCDPNPGPGGWAAVLTSGGQRHELSGREARTTNNRMELTAAIKALGSLKRPCRVEVYTDSQYLRRGISSWVAGWQRNGWRTRSGSPVENQDLWQALLEQAARHEVTWHWVRGHQGDPLNERADELATLAQRGTSAPPARRVAAPAPDEGLQMIDIYCQGSCLGNPGPGGYAAVIVTADGISRLVSGGWPQATNNAMELWAAIAGLRSLQRTARVRMHTGSKYVIDGATRWLAEWEKSGWRTRSRRPVQNAELWRELTIVLGDHDVSWHYAPPTPPNPNLQAAASAARAAAAAQ